MKMLPLPRKCRNDVSAGFVASFIELAKKTCFATLVGIVPADEDVAASETLSQ